MRCDDGYAQVAHCKTVLCRIAKRYEKSHVHTDGSELDTGVVVHVCVRAATRRNTIVRWETPKRCDQGHRTRGHDDIWVVLNEWVGSSMTSI